MSRRAINISNLLEGIMEDEDVIRHIRRDPHKTIAMNRLQEKQAIGDRFRNWQLDGCQFQFVI